MAKEYYAVVNGEQKGPFNADQLAELFAGGEINGESGLWCEGMAEWAAASSVEEFSPFITAQVLYEEAKELRQNEQYEMAIAKYNEVLRLNSRHYRAMGGKGAALRELSDGANLLVDNLLRLEPLEESALKEQAAAALTRALEIKPDYVFALQEMGIMYADKGDTEQAVKAFTRATQLDPDDAFAFFKLGDALFTQKKFDEAIEALTRATQLNPEWASPNDLLSGAWEEKGDMEKADFYAGEFHRLIGEDES